MAYQAFLSHSETDISLATSLKREIERFEASVYMYEHDRRPGEELREKIIREVRNSQVLLALLTDGGAYSPTLNQEIGIAFAENTVVIPVADEGITVGSFPLLQGLEWIWFEPNSTEKLTSEVADQVERLRKKEFKQNVAAAAALGGLLAWARLS